jgi:hypothetical protein
MITAFSKCFFDFTRKTEIFEADACLFERKKKFQVGTLLSTTLYLMPAKLGSNRTTLRGVKSLITTFSFQGGGGWRGWETRGGGFP